MAVFKSIPYATATRFAPPVAATAHDDELDATAYRAQCPQLFGPLEQALGASSLPADEDCLHLSVFTPDDGEVPDGRPRPVVVWIHGGAFTAGTGAMPWYDGSALAARGDLVVVTINYRLGALGFSGRTNCGLRDQVAALDWVRRHVGAFGGDPEQVTIVGESAGGASVIALMATPTAAGLFHRAFAMSPSIGQLRSGERADEALVEYLREAGATSLDELRAVDVGRLLEPQGTILARGSVGFTGFSPCVDGEFVPEPFLEAAARSTVPLVIGTTRDEMLLFSAFRPDPSMATDEALGRYARSVLGELAPVAIDRYRVRRPGDDAARIGSAIQTDHVFRQPARRLADARAAHGSPTWMYWFTLPSTAFGGAVGSCHALDIPYVFHNLHRPGVEMFTGDGDHRHAVADAYSQALVSLACSGSPGWPAHDVATRPTMVFDTIGGLVHDPEPELRELWMAGT